MEVEEVRFLISLFVAAATMSAGSIGYGVTPLASDMPGVAPVTDPGLINPWGITASSTSPFWLSINGNGTSELYNGAGVKQSLAVTIPGSTPSPTGVVFNSVPAAFNGDLFLFASEDGTISGWRGALGTSAETLMAGSNANVYKGITLATVGGNTYAYEANFRTGAIDVMPGTSGAPALTGSFTDPNLPAGYAPFNIENLGGVLFVTYAVQDPAKHDDVAGPGNGVVDEFDLNGNFLGRVAAGGPLNSPWGLAIAPAGFGDIGGDLLVGNFGDGTIHVYNPTTDTFIETLDDQMGNPITIDGLWGLDFGNGQGSGSTMNLYFTAGPNSEADGLFGFIATPEPGTFALIGLGLAGAMMYRRRATGTP
jgi:uncharacterized protein (TIGR03118 family)